MLATSPVAPDKPNGRRWPTRVDARLVERIVEDFVPDIETEAVSAFLVGEWCESIIDDALTDYAALPQSANEPPLRMTAIKTALVLAFKQAASEPAV